MLSSGINWDRVAKALGQFARSHQISQIRLISTLERLMELVTRCGSYSQSRKAILRIGRTLLLFDRPQVYAAFCPDYTYENERYVYKGLGGGVPLLAQLHLAFLYDMRSLFPDLEVTFLIGDTEAHIPELQKILQISEQEFHRRLDQSLCATGICLEQAGWNIGYLSQVSPDFLSLVAFHREITLKDSAQRSVLLWMNARRAKIYEAIGYPQAIWLERTIQHAAEYLAYAQIVRERGGIVCNHTTTNLRWFGQQNTALLHNAVNVY